MANPGHDPSSAELLPSPSNVVEDPHFAVGSHRAGPVLSIVVGSYVLNLRLTAATAFLLARAIRDAQETQLMFELRAQQQQRERE
jgi:hypothetical protein